jgi:uncharacterized Zn finger protein (UPF0148 family)
MDKNISEAVELLYKGAKMLAQHCIDCKMPLFEYEGKIICPACKREFKIDEKGRIIPIESEEKKKVKKDDALSERDRREEVCKNVDKNTCEIEEIGKSEYLKAKSILKSKLFEIILKTKECESIDCLHDLTDLALKIIELLEKIERL